MHVWNKYKAILLTCCPASWYANSFIISKIIFFLLQGMIKGIEPAFKCSIFTILRRVCFLQFLFTQHVELVTVESVDFVDLIISLAVE